MELKTFDKTDWDGWGGCEPFDNGDDPLIADCELGVLIVDGSGAQFYIIDSEGCDISWYLAKHFSSAESAKEFFREVVSNITFSWLYNMGFKFNGF